MGAGNGGQPVDMVELGGHLISKEPPRASRTDGPCVDVLGVAPNEITKGALMRNLLCTGHDPDLINGPDFGAEAAVYAEHGTVDDGRQDQKVKHLTARLPDGCVAVFLLALLVEPVHLGDLPRLVVAPNQHYPVGVSACC